MAIPVWHFQVAKHCKAPQEKAAGALLTLQMHHQWIIRDKFLAILLRVKRLLLKVATSFPDFSDHAFLHWAGVKCWKSTSYEHCLIWFQLWRDLTVTYNQAALFQCPGYTPESADYVLWASLYSDRRNRTCATAREAFTAMIRQVPAV